MTPSLFFPILSDRQGPESLLGQPCLPQSSVQLHVFALGEVHTHMGIRPFEAWHVLAHMEG